MQCVRYYIETDALGHKSRHRIVRWRGWDGYWVRWTQACSGCVAADGSNFGCHECGYTGKCRRSWFQPIDVDAWSAWQDRVWARLERLRRYWERKA